MTPIENGFAPIAIGGVGGSGTRLVAQMLDRLGYYTGDDKNESLDNLWFTLLFKRKEILHAEETPFSEVVDIFVQAMEQRPDFTGRQRALVNSLPSYPPPDLSAEWLRQRGQSLLAARWTPAAARRSWGWKEPNTHVVIDRLVELIPSLKYVHVVRNGLDMAFSSNQNQLRLWGSHFLGEATVEITPPNSLRYWRAAHERILEIGKGLGERFLLLSFDRLCLEPGTALDSFLEFLRLRPSAQQRRELVGLIHPPPSIGRFKKHSLLDFDQRDIEYVRSLGFDTMQA